MIAFLSALALASFQPVALPATVPQDGSGEKNRPRRSWTISADKIYTADGNVVENGFVRVEDGKIRAIGKGAGDAELHVAAITPGLVEAASQISLGPGSVEQDREVTPEFGAEEGIDLFSTDWTRQLKDGVTTTVAIPDDYNVVGGQPVVIKTGGGEPTFEDRVVGTGTLLRGCFGQSPSYNNSPFSGRPFGIFNRRPTTRMGVEWEIRDAFYKAVRSRRDASFTYPGADVLLRVLDGDLPIMIHASASLDIRTAMLFKEEFAIPHLVIEGAAEAMHEPEMLVRCGASVVLPPFSFSGNTGTDGAYMPWNTAEKLRELGVTFALSGTGSSDPDQALALQPAHAMRGGLPFDAALEAVTIVPARMLGVDDRVGSIATGKDADLLLWSGKPFEYTSRIVGVLVSGELAVDPRIGQEL